MGRWTKRAIAGVVALLLLILLGALGAAYQWLATRRDLAATPPPGQLVDIGGYRLHLWCMGAGAPAVVLESGLSAGAADAIHRELQRDLLALSTRSCQMIAARSDHAIAGDEPELVVKAIRAVMNAVRDGRGRPAC